MMSKTTLLVCLCIALSAAIPGVWAQGPLNNPSFEQGLDGWTAYSYQPSPETQGADPVVGSVGDPPGIFDVLIPSSVPDGDNVCGLQSWGTTKNGGVYQTYAWAGGPASVSVTARAYSQKYDGIPMDNGCRVRIGLLQGTTVDRSLVTWVTLPWSDSWTTRSIRVPEPGVYTLFIESLQPNADAIMSTLWDKVEFYDLPNITVLSGPTITADDPLHPDSSITIRWTTDVPCTSRVDYGLTADYGQYVEDTALVTQHIVVLTGLAHSSTYYIRAKSTSDDYADWYSDKLCYNTPVQFQDIMTRLSRDGQNTIISWKTDVPTTSQVEYWPDSDVHTFTTEDTNLVVDHEAEITGLAENCDFSFRVLARNTPYYSDAQSQVMHFRTLPAISPALANGGFEASHGSEPHSLYPWVQYATPSDSGYHPIDGLVGPYPKGSSNRWFAGIQAFDGSYFVGAASNAAFKNGGVFQRVSSRPGELYTFSARYATYRSGGESGYTQIRIGIDPEGGVDPASTNIKWWEGYSDTNDNQWHGAAVTAVAADTGVMTVFLEIAEKLPIAWHVVAVDGANLDQPKPMSIGSLKSSTGTLGATFENKTVTYVWPGIYSFRGQDYIKAYIEEDNRSSGVAVLFPTDAPDYPTAGNKITVTGALGLYDQEAALMAGNWTVDHNTYPIPGPLAMPLSAIGKSSANQPPLYGNPYGLCTVGLRVRVNGCVKWASPEGMAGYPTLAYIDDGTNLQDHHGHQGLRVTLEPRFDYGVFSGDNISVTGVLTVQLIDPDAWPDTGDEYYTYAVVTATGDDWLLNWTSSPPAVSPN